MAAGLLVRRDRTFAEVVMREISARAPDLPVVFNEPYRIEDDSDYTIPVHGEARGLPHVLIEIRNDLIADAAGVTCWSALLAGAVEAAAAQQGG
jgi:predicted N-formylglutamate amidohydrolase